MIADNPQPPPKINPQSFHIFVLVRRLPTLKFRSSTNVGLRQNWQFTSLYPQRVDGIQVCCFAGGSISE
jgi:hypothetical protein